MASTPAARSRQEPAPRRSPRSEAPNRRERERNEDSTLARSERDSSVVSSAGAIHAAATVSVTAAKTLPKPTSKRRCARDHGRRGLAKPQRAASPIG